MSVCFVLEFTVCVTCGNVNKKLYAFLYLVRHYNGSESMYWDGVWSRCVCVCERASVFSSSQHMCTTSVSSYLLSSVCFKWHMCIKKRHTYL